MREIQRLRILVVLSLFILNGGSLLAQEVTGTISGRVVDSLGAVVPGTTLQIQNVETGFTRSNGTDGAGRYIARNLPPGSYSVTAQRTGFRTEVRRGITVTVGSGAVVDFELNVGEVQERIEVTAEAPLVETTNATVSGLVDQQQMRDMPLNGRSYEYLALLSPGVAHATMSPSGAAWGGGLHLSVNGARPSANLYLLDGTVINDHSNQGPGSAAGQNLGVEAIREFRVLTHNFSAEYGRNAGAVVSAVTRSGTNEFHGSVYEFLRNNALDARDFFNPGELPPFRRNQFGASLGGPLVKDRMFFFANYEGLRERRGVTVISFVPDENARNGLLPDPVTRVLRPVTLNPAVKPYLDLYPLPNGRRFGDGVAENVTDASSGARDDYSMERMDFRLSDKDSFYWRYVFDPANSFVPQPVPVFSSTIDSTDHFVVLSETHVFSGSAINDFRFSFNRRANLTGWSSAAELSPSLSFVPGEQFGDTRSSVSVGGTGIALTDLGGGFASGQGFTQNLFQVADSMSYVKGAHSWKFGADLQHIQLNVNFGPARRGVMIFPSLPSLLAGTPTTFQFLLVGESQGVKSFPLKTWDQILFAWFVQDDVRVRPNLTLNLGLRHEFITVPEERYGRSGNLRNVTDPQSTVGPPFSVGKATFAPRVGLAWDPTGSGKTSVRLGAGLFYNHLLGREFYFFSTRNSAFHSEFRITNPPFPYGLSQGFTPTLRAEETIGFDSDTPMSAHYNLQIQRQLASTVSLGVAYVSSYSYNQISAAQRNVRAPIIQPDGRKFFSPTAPRPNPNFSDIEQMRTNAISNYHSLQLEFQKALSHGVQLQAGYTWSKGLADSDSISGTQNRGTSQATLDADNLAADYGFSSYDQRHLFSLTGRYAMPWDSRFTSGVAKGILGGWVIGGIVRAGSGFPVNLESGFNNSQNGDSRQPDRPNLVPGASTSPTEGTTAGCQGVPAGEKLGTPDRYFDPCAFELPPPGYFGNLARNALRGPSLFVVDFVLEKATSLGERAKLGFRAEFFNLLNHANFGIPQRFLFTSTRARNLNAGRLRETATNARQIQFGMKLTF